MFRHRILRLMALCLAISLPLLGLSGTASAKVKAAKGCHRTHTCKTAGGGGAGTGTGPRPPSRSRWTRIPWWRPGPRW